MKIIVCIKQVPKETAPLAFTKWIHRDEFLGRCGQACSGDRRTDAAGSARRRGCKDVHDRQGRQGAGVSHARPAVFQIWQLRCDVKERLHVFYLV